jgi:hypothetical protein
VANAYSDQTKKGDLHGWHVYLLEEEGGAFCKIGSALTIDYRLSGLKNGNPRALTIAKSWHLSSRSGARSVEARALELCGNRRLPGRDWVRGPAIETAPKIEFALTELGGLRGSNS